MGAFRPEQFILKEDETPTSIGGELRQFRLGGNPISFQDKVSGGSQAWSVEECGGSALWVHSTTPRQERQRRS